MPKELSQKGIAFIPILIWAVAILFIGTAAVKEELIKLDLNGNKPLVQKVDVIPTLSPNPTFIPTQKPIVKDTVPVPTSTTDPDPIITCNIHKDCGGGSTRLRSSICSNSTCCGFSDGRWVFYESKTKCTQDQNTQSINARKPNYVPPSVTTQTGTEPLVNCTLSFGTVQVTQSDCDLFKKNDVPPSTNNQTVIVTPDPAIQQQRQSSLKSCMDNANTNKERDLTIPNLGELGYQQILRNWAQAENQCHSLYGY